MDLTEHIMFMEKALDQAHEAEKIGEVPVGAVIVRHGEIVSYGYNKRETDKNAIYHAEIEAIDSACKKLGSWRLLDCSLYVTLEPCPMCAGAIINSRIKRVIFGAKDSKAGSCGSIINLFDLPYNHRPEIISGVMGNECQALLSDFFGKLRNSKNKSLLI